MRLAIRVDELVRTRDKSHADATFLRRSAEALDMDGLSDDEASEGEDGDEDGGGGRRRQKPNVDALQEVRLGFLQG